MDRVFSKSDVAFFSFIDERAIKFSKIMFLANLLPNNYVIVEFLLLNSAVRSSVDQKYFENHFILSTYNPNCESIQNASWKTKFYQLDINNIEEFLFLA